MAVIEGVETYCVDAAHVRARGVTWDEATLGELLQTRVVDLLLDARGRDDLQALVGDLPETHFEHQLLQETLATDPPVEPWRICEALGEVFLTDGRGCFFPWPSGRDLRNPAGSPPGADLVGFEEVAGDDVRFAFGEVKSSESESAPPNVMYGRSGLVAQLEALQLQPATQAALIRYLGHRAGGTDWQERYRAAFVRFLRDSTDTALFGVLIRDTRPDPLDLESRASALAQHEPGKTSVELRAKYLDSGTLGKLTDEVSRMINARNA